MVREGGKKEGRGRVVSSAIQQCPDTPAPGCATPAHRAWGRPATRSRPSVVEGGLAREGGVIEGGLTMCGLAERG